MKRMMLAVISGITKPNAVARISSAYYYSCQVASTATRNTYGSRKYTRAAYHKALLSFKQNDNCEYAYISCIYASLMQETMSPVRYG